MCRAEPNAQSRAPTGGAASVKRRSISSCLARRSASWMRIFSIFSTFWSRRAIWREGDLAGDADLLRLLIGLVVLAPLGADLHADILGFEHLLDIGEREAEEILQLLHTLDSLHVRWRVEPEAADHACRRRQQAALLVIAGACAASAPNVRPLRRSGGSRCLSPWRVRSSSVGRTRVNAGRGIAHSPQRARDHKAKTAVKGPLTKERGPRKVVAADAARGLASLGHARGP